MALCHGRPHGAIESVSLYHEEASFERGLHPDLLLLVPVMLRDILGVVVNKSECFNMPNTDCVERHRSCAASETAIYASSPSASQCIPTVCVLLHDSWLP